MYAYMGVYPCDFLSACVHGCPPATGRNSRAPMRTRAQTYSHALTLPHPHPQDDEPRGRGGGGDLEAPAGEVLYEGLLRRKKEDHGRFEDPYKMVCVCRLQGSVLRVRLTHNGEVFAPAHAAAAYIASARIQACVQTCFCCGCASSHDDESTAFCRSLVWKSNLTLNVTGASCPVATSPIGMCLSLSLCLLS